VARVVVRDGSVALASANPRGGAANQPTALTSGELEEVGRDGRLRPVQRVKAGSYLGWADGAVTFDGTPLSEALPELGRWYDLDIRLADSTLGGRRVTASFTTESAAQALRIVADALGLVVEQHGRTVTLVQRRRLP
jgi:transmembrane sensor